MNRWCLTVVVLTLIPFAKAPAQEPVKDPDRVVAPLPWPPPHMKGLPPDYLERIRASLVAGTARLSKLGPAKTKGNESIGYTRYGMPALILGKRADDINRFFESGKFVWTTNPKFGFSLFSTSYMRLYGLMNHHTGPMKGPLSPRAIANIEKEMWAAAKVNSKLSEAKRPVWHMEGSENHHLSSKTCDLLAAQFLRKLPEYAKQRYDDGSTLEEQYEVRRAYFHQWIEARAKRGQFVEAGSPSYQGDSIAALFNLRDFAEDPLLRRKVDMYLDLTYAVIAEETLLTARGGPKSRVKVGHEYGGAADRGYDLLFNAPGSSYVPLGVGSHSTSDYYPPPVVVNLARDTTGRGNYVFQTRWPGPLAEGGGRSSDDPDGILWRTLDPERSVLRYGFATPDFVLGSAGLDPKWLDDAGMSSRWQGVIFRSDPLARIGFEVKPQSSKEWHAFNAFFSVQDRNVLVTQKWAATPPNPKTSLPSFLRVYFSPTLDDVRDEDGWIFARAGQAFAAVKVAGGYQWTPAWKRGGDRAFVTLESESSPVILIVNQASDYASDFDKFKAAIRAQPVLTKDGTLHFAAITFHGTTRLPEVGGRPVNLARSRGYDSPFIRSEWNSGLIHIRKGNDTEILDFRDPANPIRTVGGPVTSDFPPGIGDARPIVFP